MKELIDDLLRYSRVGTQGNHFDMVDMNSVVSSVLEVFSISVEEYKTVIELDPLPSILADDPQMVQLMQNRITNAIKFRRPEPLRIYISATPTRRAHFPDVPASS
jgi:light-regulated signal transduction histidine kinase (bacteriophytochrome)